MSTARLLAARSVTKGYGLTHVSTSRAVIIVAAHPEQREDGAKRRWSLAAYASLRPRTLDVGAEDQTSTLQAGGGDDLYVPAVEGVGGALEFTPTSRKTPIAVAVVPFDVVQWSFVVRAHEVGGPDGTLDVWALDPDTSPSTDYLFSGLALGLYPLPIRVR